MPRQWSPEDVLTLARGFQPACVLFAAADLEVFDLLAGQAMTARQVAAQLGADPRATAILLDALAALDLLLKNEETYRLAPGVADTLATHGPHSVLAMTQHQANCLRRWIQLAEVVKSGGPAERRPSIRGEAADQASFIEAMDNLSRPMAPNLVADIRPLAFRHLLDIGGASGTWTIAFLRAAPQARATLFDLPAVIAMARRRLTEAGVADRVELAPGDFYADALPPGADFAWVSAIVHQNSRAQNRSLLAKVFQALEPGGQIAIRDIVMDESRTQPPAGALFAVNMLVGTPEGGTFTFRELADDLGAAGFVEASLLRRGQWMDSIVRAVKPR